MIPLTHIYIVYDRTHFLLDTDTCNTFVLSTQTFSFSDMMQSYKWFPQETTGYLWRFKTTDLIITSHVFNRRYPLDVGMGEGIMRILIKTCKWETNVLPRKQHVTTRSLYKTIDFYQMLSELKSTGEDYMN